MIKSSRKFLAAFLGLLVLIHFSGCASFQGRNFNQRITKSQKKWRFSGVPYYGEQILPVDSTMQGQIQNILDKIVYVSPLRGYRFPIVLVEGDNPAFTDGRTIYLNVAFLQAFWHDQSLIAAVIAHEFAHILAGHDPKKFANQGYFYNAIAPIVGLIRFGAFINLAVKETMVMNQRSYSRFQEKEADAIAVLLVKETGYDPYGLNRFFDYIEKARLGKLSGINIPITNYANPSSAATGVALLVLHSSTFYRTHPSPKKRLSYVDLMIKSKQNNSDKEVLNGKDAHLARVYRVIEARRPKNKSS